jgi:hypothetical protein
MTPCISKLRPVYSISHQHIYIIDKNDIIGNSARVKSVALTPCGHRRDKNRIYAALKELTKFETLQTVEETLFANRKSKESMVDAHAPWKSCFSQHFPNYVTSKAC